MIWTKVFWKATAERAVKTAAQVAAVSIGGNVFNAWELDYGQLAGITLGGAILSVLTSIGSSKVTGDGPSLTNVEVLDPTKDTHQAYKDDVDPL